MSRKQMLFVCSEEFKEALGEYAAKHKLSESEVARLAISTFIGYDASNETFVDKRKKYFTTEERVEAQRNRMRERRAEEKKLLEAIEHEEHLRNILAIEMSVERKTKCKK